MKEEEINFITRYEEMTQEATKQRLVTYRYQYKIRGKPHYKMERRNDFLCPFGCGESSLFSSLKSLLLHIQTVHTRFRICLGEDSTGNPQLQILPARTGTGLKKKYAHKTVAVERKSQFQRELHHNWDYLYLTGANGFYFFSTRVVHNKRIPVEELMEMFLPEFEQEPEWKKLKSGSKRKALLICYDDGKGKEKSTGDKHAPPPKKKPLTEKERTTYVLPPHLHDVVLTQLSLLFFFKSFPRNILSHNLA